MAGWVTGIGIGTFNIAFSICCVYDQEFLTLVHFYDTYNTRYNTSFFDRSSVIVHTYPCGD